MAGERVILLSFLSLFAIEFSQDDLEDYFEEYDGKIESAS